jgi:hypothetical protein
VRVSVAMISPNMNAWILMLPNKWKVQQGRCSASALPAYLEAEWTWLDAVVHGAKSVFVGFAGFVGFGVCVFF